MSYTPPHRRPGRRAAACPGLDPETIRDLDARMPSLPQEAPIRSPGRRKNGPPQGGP